MDYRKIYSKKFNKHLMKVVVTEEEYENILKGVDLLIEQGDPDAVKLKRIITKSSDKYIPYNDEEISTMPYKYRSFVIFEDNLYTLGIVGIYLLALEKQKEELIEKIITLYGA